MVRSVIRIGRTRISIATVLTVDRVAPIKNEFRWKAVRPSSDHERSLYEQLNLG